MKKRKVKNWKRKVNKVGKEERLMEDQKDKERRKEKKRSERERGLSRLKNYLHSYTTVVPICNKLLTVYK